MLNPPNPEDERRECSMVGRLSYLAAVARLWDEPAVHRLQERVRAFLADPAPRSRGVRICRRASPRITRPPNLWQIPAIGGQRYAARLSVTPAVSLRKMLVSG